MNLGSRLKKAIEMAGTTPPEVARKSGVPVASLNALIRRDSRRSEFTEQLMAVLPGDKVNLDWVRTGNGKPQPSVKLQLVGESASHQGNGITASPAIRAAGSTWEQLTDLPPGPQVFIPKLEVSLVADGTTSRVVTVFSKSQAQAFLASDVIRADQLDASGLAYTVALDASMEPAMFQGDRIVVDTKQTAIVDGKTFAIHYGEGHIVVRRLLRLPGGGLRIETYNPGFPSHDLGSEQAQAVAILGRVVYRGGGGMLV